jgi:hypothetical protein
MQGLFHTEALSLVWGAGIVVVGFSLLVILETEKALLRRYGAMVRSGSRSLSRS